MFNITKSRRWFKPMIDFFRSNCEPTDDAQQTGKPIVEAAVLMIF